jgi:hypothetical protein
MKISDLRIKILEEMERSEFDVFFRSDFDHLATYQQVGKALSELCTDSKTLRIGTGLYCLAREATFIPGKIVPKTKGLLVLAREALNRLGFEVVMSKAERDNIERRSTQVPNGRRLAIKGKKTKRRIGYADTYLTYEYAE